MPDAIDRAEIARLAAWARGAAAYFGNRPTGGEDAAFWANLVNQEAAEKVAGALELLLRRVGESREWSASVPTPESEPRLCYVNGAWAWFTHLPLDQQWGDDWNDAPYEHNAGNPYDCERARLVKLAFDGPFETPDFSHLNSPYSVQDINRGAVPWLTVRQRGLTTTIMAGATLSDFGEAVEMVGGTVYLPRQVVSSEPVSIGHWGMFRGVKAA